MNARRGKSNDNPCQYRWHGPGTAFGIRVTLMTVLLYDLVSSELTYGNGGRQYLLDWGIRRLYV